jgi:hypothetical protein
MKTTSNQVLKFLNVLAWILFIGLCVEAGSIIFNAIFTFFWNSENANYFGLTNLFQFDSGYFLVILSLMSIVAVLKAILFYLIVKMSTDKTLSLDNPFQIKVKEILKNIAYLALGIGLFSIWIKNYAIWFVNQGVEMPPLEKLNAGGGDVWLFLCVILFVLVHLFNRAIEIQSENELTI